MTPQAQTNFSDVHDSLWRYIHSGSPIEQSAVDDVEKDIRLLDGVQKAYLTALLYGAKRDYDSAIAWFNEALKSEDATIALNYLAYVGASAHNYFHRMEIFRLEEQYGSTEMRRVARNAAFCIGNQKLMRIYNLKLSALCDGEEKQFLKEQGESMISIVEEFKQAAKLSSNDIEELCDEAEAIANKRGVNCIGAHYFLNGESDNAYIIRAETSDAELLAEMNMELLCLLSSEKYIERPFTSWFRSDVSKKEERCDC